MELAFKNPQIVNELFDTIQINYKTWVYNEEYDYYYDVIFSDKALTIIGKDIVSEHPFSKISSCVAYFGVDDEEYDENYIDVEFHWEYGSGEIVIAFSDWSGSEWRLVFKQARFEDAKRFFIELRKRI